MPLLSHQPDMISCCHADLKTIACSRIEDCSSPRVHTGRNTHTHTADPLHKAQLMLQQQTNLLLPCSRQAIITRKQMNQATQNKQITGLQDYRITGLAHIGHPRGTKGGSWGRKERNILITVRRHHHLARRNRLELLRLRTTAHSVLHACTSESCHSS